MAEPLPIHPAILEDAETDVMARNRITRIEAYQYHVDGYRYSNLADALAQVARESRKRAL